MPDLETGAFHLRLRNKYDKVKPYNTDGGIIMDKYVCPCGYVYDPTLGDPDANVPMGTAFDELPEDWVCPVCGLDKSAFTKVED